MKRFTPIALVLLVLATAGATPSTHALNRGHVLYGTVTGLGGGPIENVEIVVIDEKTRTELGYGKVLTNAEGEYTITDLPTGRWKMLLKKDGYAPISRYLEMNSTLYTEYMEDVQLLAHTTDEQEDGLFLPDGASVKKKALKLRDKAHQAVAVGDFEKAIKSLEKAIAIDPTFARAYTELGIENHRKGDLVKAEDYYEKGIEKNPGDPVPMVNLAGLWLSQKKVAQCVPLLEKALKVDARLPRGHLYLGQAYLSLKRYADAEMPLRRACQLDERGCAQAYGHLGTVYVKLDQPREAREAYARYLELNPRDPRAENLKRAIGDLDREIAERNAEARATLESRGDLSTSETQ